MKAERPQSRRKPEALSVDWDDTVVRRPRKKAATTSTLFRNVIIGLVVVAAAIYALSLRYDLAKLLVIDLNNPSASLARARTDDAAPQPAPAADASSTSSASHATGHAAQPTHGTNQAPSSNVALPANVNVAPVYLGGKEKK